MVQILNEFDIRRHKQTNNSNGNGRKNETLVKLNKQLLLK